MLKCCVCLAMAVWRPCASMAQNGFVISEAKWGRRFGSTRWADATSDSDYSFTLCWQGLTLPKCLTGRHHSGWTQRLSRREGRCHLEVSADFRSSWCSATSLLLPAHRMCPWPLAWQSWCYRYMADEARNLKQYKELPENSKYLFVLAWNCEDLTCQIMPCCFWDMHN